MLLHRAGIGVLLLLLLLLVWQLSSSDALEPVAALILARGGSKGIPLKNIVELQPNVTLLGRALQTIQRSALFDSIWVSTDHERIAQEAASHGASVFARSATHAQDHSSSLDATAEFLEAHPEIDRLALIQCTSPFLRVHYLEEAIVQHSSAASPCVFSVVRSYRLRWRKQKANGRLEALNFDPRRRPRRQDWSGELVEAGMFYFADRHLVMEERTFQSERCGVVEVDELDALEIDDVKDLELARLLIELH